MTTPKDLIPTTLPIPKTKISGIYIIYCTADEKAYIGSSVNIKVRIGNHKADLRGKNHTNAHLQNAWNQYGEQEFKFGVLEIVEKVTPEMLLERENYFLLGITRKLLFNMAIPAVLSPEKRLNPKARTLKGEDHHNSIVTLELANKIKEDYLKVVKPGKVVPGIRKRLGEKYNLRPTLIGNICTGHHWTNPNYIWKNSAAEATISNKGEIKQKRGVSEKIITSKEICNTIYTEWFSEREEKLGTKAFILGLTTKLANKYGVHVDTIRKICSGKHPNSPIHGTKTKYKIDKYDTTTDFDLINRILVRYEEVRKERNLLKVPGIKESLAKEFNVSIQNITKAFRLKREGKLL